MGRKTIGERPMTAAERQQRRRAKIKRMRQPGNYGSLVRAGTAAERRLLPRIEAVVERVRLVIRPAPRYTPADIANMLTAGHATIELESQAVLDDSGRLVADIYAVEKDVYQGDWTVVE